LARANILTAQFLRD